MNKAVAKVISKVILAERTVRIKLLGDSITHGEGGTGFKQDGEPIVEGFARNKDGYCWAKQFKEHMEAQFDCTVTNNACTGTNIEFVIDNFEQLVDADDDIVICTIGTNNRHQYFTDLPKRTKHEHMKIFYGNIIKLYNKFAEMKKDVIFVANIPASAENEKDKDNFWRIFHMNDVNDLYMKASTVCGFPFISMYSRFMEYCELKGIAVDSLLSDGLHPNDKGYDVMFKLILDELGLGRSVC
ncbi:MAG: SGNH/GDSL hydrolase family protein [Clostridia bacterium]|nr:SGNH/GDSL hydrolase family protein [Clostridia bacterium]